MIEAVSSNSSNCYFRTTPNHSIIVGIALCAIGSYLTTTEAPTIAYSVITAGGVVLLGTLLAHALFVCKTCKSVTSDLSITNAASHSPNNHKNEIYTDANTHCDTQQPTRVDTREPIQLIERMLYEPKRKLLSDATACITNYAQAQELLLQKGQHPGDFTFYAGERCFKLFVLTENKDILRVTIKDPTESDGRCYQKIYEELKYPILPSKCSISEVYSTWMGYKFLAIAKECSYIGFCIPNYISLELHDLHMYQYVQWLKRSPSQVNFNPAIFFQLIGNLFGLIGEKEFRNKNVQFIRNFKVYYNGYYAACGNRLIQQDMLGFLNQTPNFAAKDRLIQMCQKGFIIQHKCVNSPKPEQLLTLLDQNIPITFGGGWNRHTINITMTKDALIYINKGENAKTPGMHHYKINKLVSKKKLKKIFRLYAPQDYPDQPNSTLERILDLRIIDTYKTNMQKVPNCVFASTRRALKAGLLLLGMLPAEAQSMFLSFRHWQRMKWLDAFFTIIDKTTPCENLEKELYFCLILLATKLVLKQKIIGYETDCDHEILNAIQQKAKEFDPKKPYVKELLLQSSRDHTKDVGLHGIEQAHKDMYYKLIKTCKLSYAKRLKDRAGSSKHVLQTNKSMCTIL